MSLEEADLIFAVKRYRETEYGYAIFEIDEDRRIHLIQHPADRYVDDYKFGRRRVSIGFPAYGLIYESDELKNAKADAELYNEYCRKENIGSIFIVKPFRHTYEAADETCHQV